MGVARTVMGVQDPGHLVDRLGEIAAEVIEEARRDGVLTSEVLASRVRDRLRGAGVALPDSAS